MAATGNEVPLLSQLKQLKDWFVSQLNSRLSKLDSLSINDGILAVSSGGTGGDNKTDARHGIGMMDLLWSGSIEITGETTPSPALFTNGISNYHVLVVRFSGRSAPCILSRFGQSNWFYGDSSYTAGNGAETIYTLGIRINDRGNPNEITELRCCSHVIDATGTVGDGSNTATISNIYGVA